MGCRYDASPRLGHCTFTDNSADSGGAVYCVNSCVPELSHCTFEKNSAEETGGALYGSIIATSCLFTGNKAKNGGAAAYGFFHECTFVGNGAAENGGAASGGSYYDCLIFDNMALENGGALTGSVTLHRSAIIKNAAGSHGGALFNEKDSEIEDCRFEENTAGLNGGAICSPGKGGLFLEDSYFAKNQAGYNGGAVYSQFMVVNMNRCTLTKNEAAFGHGGGLYIFDSYNSYITKSTFLGNSGIDGGGVYVIETGLELVDTAFQGNSAKDFGGGLASDGDGVVMANCTFHENTAGKRGGGYHCQGYCWPEVVNSIFWKDHAPEGAEIAVGTGGNTSILTISHSDVEGGEAGVHVHPDSMLNWGEGMIDGDPLFVEPGRGDLHLLYPSPCRDTGYIFGIMDLYDFEGDDRNFNKVADMGIDEFHPHLYCTGEAVPGSEIELKAIGEPGKDALLLAGNGVLDPPWETPYGDLYLTAPFIVIDVGPVPWNGLIRVHQDVPPDIPAPLAIPLQALIRERLTNLCVIEVRSP
jgi:predicted outer membrane repeat protein